MTDMTQACEMLDACDMTPLTDMKPDRGFGRSHKCEVWLE